MAGYQAGKTVLDAEEENYPPTLPIPTGQEKDRPAHAATGSNPADEDDGDTTQDIITACYLCHGQCANFGVHGKVVRPCARGMTEIINRRRVARRNSQATAGTVAWK